MFWIISAQAVLLAGAVAYAAVCRVRLRRERIAAAQAVQDERARYQEAANRHEKAANRYQQALMRQTDRAICAENQRLGTREALLTLRGENDQLTEDAGKLRGELAAAREECQKWRYAAEHARQATLTEVQNLLSYTGTEEGQHDITE